MKCPTCNTTDERIYHGWSTVECINPSCFHYRPELIKPAASAWKPRVGEPARVKNVGGGFDDHACVVYALDSNGWVWVKFGGGETARGDIAVFVEWIPRVGERIAERNYPYTHGTVTEIDQKHRLARIAFDGSPHRNWQFPVAGLLPEI